MRKTRPCGLLLALLLFAAVPAAAAPENPRTPPIRELPYPGTLDVHVDARDTQRRIFRVRETLPVQPGPLTLLYPEWIPGNHRPSGQIEKVAGLTVTADGERLEWTRDPFDVYVFHLTVPDGVDEVEVRFDYLSPLDPAQGRVVMTPSMLNLQWNLTMIYPAGYEADDIPVDASVTLPAGWQYATAAETERRDGDTVHFKTLDWEMLQDSPIFAGAHYRQYVLDDDAEAPVRLNVFADQPKYLEAKPEQIEAHRGLVEQADKLYGARHFDHYDFLLGLTEQLGGIGLEHHRSSENTGKPSYFTEWETHWSGRDLLPHEYNHSWNGKFRRGADLLTPNFNVKMGDRLLWLYEGQTQFYGQVLSARSGLWSQDQALASLANIAAIYDRGRPGLSWRALQDTTRDPTINSRRPQPYRSYQLSEDYYNAGLLIWLAVDAKLRELTRNRRSIDDFARAFFGMDDGSWTVRPYTFDDIVSTLDGIAGHDWAGFLRAHLDGDAPLTGGVGASGWQLIYNDTPNAEIEAWEKSAKALNLTYSLGLVVGEDGEIGDVLWDGPAFKAGVAPKMKLVAVNGREFSKDGIKDAISAAKTDEAPIELLVKNFDRFETLRIDDHDGLQYPHLQRIDGAPDYLSQLLKAR